MLFMDHKHILFKTALHCYAQYADSSKTFPIRLEIEGIKLRKPSGFLSRGKSDPNIPI